ncbi:C11orf54 [Bugula neritina]|uniref:C11orf54 n=1 Tax=Bugula neritina TaxID=10212 RepID=A0A7J7JJ22_BUGNE|nr:C11orf54 [Bugula neritina]
MERLLHILTHYLLNTSFKKFSVLEVKARTRTGNENFMSAIRKVLAEHYGDQPVALGGTFLLEQGKAKFHIMPDFSTCPVDTEEKLNNWLKFYEYEAPVTAVGYLVSHDPGLDLRVEHFHCFTNRGVGGHYHYDTTPDEVAYRGYFGIADTLYRIDQPPVTSEFGKD